MNKLKINLLMISFGLASFAATSSLAAGHRVSGGGSILFTINATTPDNKEIIATDMIMALGHMQNGGCEIAKTIDMAAQFPGAQMTIQPGPNPTDANQFAMLAGPGFTCMNSTTIYQGKRYSTGNIELTWDGAQYTQAKPSTIEMNFT